MSITSDRWVENRIALVTGAGSGIGRSVVLVLAKAGYRVVVNDIVEGIGEQVLSEIKKNGGQGFFAVADVSDAIQVKKMFERAEKAYGGIDILVNNAGTPGAFSLITDTPDEVWHKTISVHLTGTFYCIREAARSMKAKDFGRIINMASIAGILGTVGSGEYGAAKAGVINLTRTAAKELGPYHITVNAIAPGMVETPTNLRLKNKGSRFIETAIEGTPTGRMTMPEEIAETVLFLSSRAGANINGQVITIDGGFGITSSMDRYMGDNLKKRRSGIVSQKYVNKVS